MMVHFSFQVPLTFSTGITTYERKEGRKGVRELLTRQRGGGDDRTCLGGGIRNEYLGRNKRK